MEHRQKRECRKTKEPCPEKTGLLREYQATHEGNFLSSWLREDVEGEEEERETMNKEAKEEESRNGKREVEGERERVEISSNRICMGCFDSLDVAGELPRPSVAALRWRMLEFLCFFVCLLRLLLCW